MEAPRITPLPPNEWPAGMKDALASLYPAHQRIENPPRRPDQPKGLNVLGTLARYPDLTRCFHTFNGHILFGTSLSARQRELLVLRVAAVRDCEYEWAQHVVMGGDVGLTPAEIKRIALGPEAGEWQGLDHGLLTAADELIADAKIGSATWTALAAELDTEQLMDVVFTVGAYDLLAMALGSFGVQLDDDLK